MHAWKEKARIPETFANDIDKAKQVVTVLQVWSQWRSRPPRL